MMTFRKIIKIKVLFILIFVIFGFNICAAAESNNILQPQELEFQPVGGGKFIYCNNPEAIDSNTIINGDKPPRYVMNNENLSPGKYYIYLSHYNFIGMDQNGEQVSKDMELDVELTPTSENCIYTLSNIGFETAEAYAYFKDGKIVKKEQEWGLLNCCASAMKKSIIDIDGEEYYPYNKESDETYDVTTANTRWLSEFIPNYQTVHYRQPVHIQAVLEIKSGTMNVNVCAFADSSFKRKGKVTRYIPENTEKGLVRYDRTIKGIADTLPQVEADLKYTIDDTAADGEAFPVIMCNQYAPDGVVNYEWITHINILDDPWAKTLGDESGMLALTYRDDNKLTYYGKNVPLSKRDNIWRFDTHHTDTHSYEGQPGTNGADNYSPNYEITAEDNTNGYAVNLGNYGVTYTYNISIANEGDKTRYFTYEPTTSSNIIVYTNENGEESEYAFTKKFSGDAKRDVMSVVELPAGHTTVFSVNVILPVNYLGGIRNAFFIRDKADKLDFYSKLSGHRIYESAPVLNGNLLSSYAEKVTPETEKIFGGTAGCYETVEYNNMYILRWCAWDGWIDAYYPAWWLCQHIYVLDSNFNIIGSHTFDSLPSGMSVNNNKLYIQTARNGIYESENGIDYIVSYLTELPEMQVLLEKFLPDSSSAVILNYDYCSISVELTENEYSRFYKAVRNIELEKNSYPKRFEKKSLITLSSASGSDFSLALDRGNENRRPWLIKNDDDYDFALDLLTNLMYFGENADTRRIGHSDWAANDIKTASECGFIPFNILYTADLFSDGMQHKISREQFCQLAVRMIKLTGSVPFPENPIFKFSDLHPYDTDNKNIRALADLGIITGYDDGEFKPNKDITRQEAAVILSRMLMLYNISSSSELGFSDNENIEDWAKESVKTVFAYGIMNGIGNNLFDPNGTYTIEQAIVTILRTFDTVVNSGYLKIPEIPETGVKYTVYREGYRNNRIEMSVYNSDYDFPELGEDGSLGIPGVSFNDTKYYFSHGRWVEFERRQNRVSNNASMVIFNGKR